MRFDKPAVPAFLLCFYGHLYSPMFATLYQEPEGDSEQDPRQEPSPATPQADIASSGDQDNPSFPPSPGGCAPDTLIWGGQEFPSTAVNLQSQALLAVRTGLQAPETGAGGDWD